MKKKIVAIACAAALMLALPTMAWAAPSPTNNGSVSDSASGTSVSVSAGSGTISNITTVSTPAGNVPAGVTPLVSYDVMGDASDVSLTFNVGVKYAGYSITIYIQHNDGTYETRTGTVASDGTISIHVDNLSVFSLVMGEAGSTYTTDKSSKSPQTGVDFGGVAGATAVMAVAAGVVFVTLRKKITE